MAFIGLSSPPSSFHRTASENGLACPASRVSWLARNTKKTAGRAGATTRPRREEGRRRRGNLVNEGLDLEGGGDEHGG